MSTSFDHLGDVLRRAAVVRGCGPGLTPTGASIGRHALHFNLRVVSLSAECIDGRPEVRPARLCRILQGPRLPSVVPTLRAKSVGLLEIPPGGFAMSLLVKVRAETEVGRPKSLLLGRPVHSPEHLL